MKPKQANNKADFETCQVPEGVRQEPFKQEEEKKRSTH